MLNRVIRLRDAPAYLGMDVRRFNSDVRPNIPEMRIGIQGVGFDRLDLDAWFEEYKARSVRPNNERGVEKWGERKYQAYSKEMASGTSTSKYRDKDFEKALDQILSKKPSAI